MKRVNNQLKNIKKEGWARRKNIFEKKGLCQVLPGFLGHRSTEFDYFFALTSLSPYVDRSSHQVDLLGRFEFNNYASKYDLYTKKYIDWWKPNNIM